MAADETQLHSAWSNGQWLFLDLEANQYLAGDREDSAARKLQHVAAAAALRECLAAPVSFLPPHGMVAWHLRASWLAWRIRRRPIRQQLDAVRSWAPKEPPRLPADRAAACAGIYQHLRNLRPRRPACLEDSVACAIFLRRYVGAVSFHIGVKQPPFMAHAWVQAGNLIANDAKHAIEDYAEIMKVSL